MILAKLGDRQNVPRLPQKKSGKRPSFVLVSPWRVANVRKYNAETEITGGAPLLASFEKWVFPPPTPRGFTRLTGGQRLREYNVETEITGGAPLLASFEKWVFPPLTPRGFTPPAF